MSHRHTVIEPAEGLTVLVGPNNCGKSAFVTALQILLHNDTSTYVLRHGAKECRVIVETDAGDRVEWIRKKSGSPSYIVNGKQYDRLRNESGVWDELKRILKMPRLEFDNNQKFDVHIGEQRNPVFLLDDKGKGAAQFFASSSDASKLVEMQALHKKQVSENRSERKRIAQQHVQVNEAIDCLADLPDLRELLCECECEFDSLKSDQKAAKDLGTLVESLKAKEAESNNLLATREALGLVKPPPEFNNPIPLEKLLAQIQRQAESIRKSERLGNAFESLEAPPEFADEVRLQLTLTAIKRQQRTAGKLLKYSQALSGIQQPPKLRESESVSDIAKLIVQLRTEIEACDELKEELANIGKDLKKVTQEIENWATENPSCPTCGNEVDAAALIDGVHRHG